MTRLRWNTTGTRHYENGIDRGVIYPLDGDPVSWNGLTGIDYEPDYDLTEIFYDGMKIHDVVSIGAFKGTMTAITYPDVLEDLQGSTNIRRGVIAHDQKPKPFNLSYRTLVGNDQSAIENNYKIHLVYNVTALPSSMTYSSLSDDLEIVEFEWDLTGVPEEISGFRPTAHFTFDSRKISKYLLAEIEEMLYGGELSEPDLPTLEDLVSFVRDWVSPVPETPQLEIIDNGNGIWTAKSDIEEVIVMIDETTFEIRDVEPSLIGEDMYRISSVE